MRDNRISVLGNDDPEASFPGENRPRRLILLLQAKISRRSKSAIPRRSTRSMSEVKRLSIGSVPRVDGR